MESYIQHLYKVQNCEIVSNYLSNLFIKSKEENDRNKDIQILERISQSIMDYEDNQSNARETLITIGDLFGKISYNDNGDRDGLYTRNRYGYIQRNRNKSINKDGIYFERFYQLKLILNDDRMYSRIPKEEIDDLTKYLPCLKAKIVNILVEYKPWIFNKNIDYEVDIDFTEFISYLMKFSSRYYSSMILERIIEELNLFESIDFSVKYSRYYFARVFSIIGELLNEYLEEKYRKDENLGVMKILKSFIKLRDQLVHHYEKIKHGFNDENQLMSEMIDEIKQQLKQVIVNTGDCVGQWTVDTSYGDAKKFQDVMDQFVNKFSDKPKKEKTQITISVKPQKKKKKAEICETDEEIKSKLKRLISRALGIIEGTKSEVKIKIKGEATNQTITDQLSFLNDQYQKLLNKLEPNDRTNYPLVLDLIHKDAIKSLGESVDIKSFKPSDPFKEKTDKISSKIQSMNEEVFCLFAFKKQMSKHNMEKPTTQVAYIIQYIVMVIGQFVRDIQGYRTEEPSKIKQHPCDSDIDYLSKPSVVSRFTSSTFMSEIVVKSKDMRNRGLAHNIWSYEEDKFQEGLKEIVSISSQFTPYCDILTNDKKPTLAVDFYMVGSALCQIKLYKEAINCLEEAITRFRDYPGEAKTTTDEKTDEEFENIFHMPIIVLSTYEALMSAYVGSGNLDKASQTNQFLLNQINYDKILECSPLATNCITRLVHFTVYVSSDLEYLKENIEKLEALTTVNDSFTLKFYLAHIYAMIRNYSKGKELFMALYKEAPENTLKYLALMGFVGSSAIDQIEEREKDEILGYIDEIEILSEKNLSDFIAAFGVGYFVQRKCLIYSKFRLILSFDFDKLDEYKIEELKKLSNQMKDVFSRIPDRVEDFKMFFSLNQFLMNFYIDQGLTFPDLMVDSLKEAEHYFDLNIDCIRKIPEELDYIKSCLIKDGYRLVGCVITNPDLSHRDKIDHLTKLLNYPHGLGPIRYALLVFVAEEYYFLGEEYLDEYYSNGKDELANRALDAYENAINCFSLALKDPLRIREYWSDTSVKVGFCLNSKSLLKYDYQLFLGCIDYWNQILSLPLKGTDKICAIECKEVIEKIFFEINAVLNTILDTSQANNKVKCHDEYVIRYLRNKFNIEIVNENNKQRWFYRGTLSTKEFRDGINQHRILSIRSYDYTSQDLTLKSLI